LLPKLEFTERLPAQCQTLVVMPTILTSDQAVRALIERLELHYLANPESGLRFALLSDFADASAEHMPNDEALLSTARHGIAELNERHANNEHYRFYLLHRVRRWNPKERLWMGWERKRGKLLELNRLLRGDTTSDFIDPEVQLTALRNTKYVITLDADTRLPHAAARRLAGTLSHPLNQPRLDGLRKRVVHGYGILQPRVSVSLASASRSLFARIYASNAGLDPYCTAVSDVYQDLFGEGSFTGKGIYDVDAFSATTDEAFPENHILSHDLIEGCYARVGLATDIEVFDEFPERLDVEVRRQHRWIRGDWQLLPWLGRRVPTSRGPERNRLSLLSHWKIFDNLRRSLVPLTLLFFLLTGWIAAPNAAWFVTSAAIIVIAGPLLAFGLSMLVTWRPGDDWRQSLEQLISALVPNIIQRLLAVSFLPLRAQYSTDAVARTLYRLFVSRRNLLEWETADAAERRLRNDSQALLRLMAWISTLAVVVLLLLPATAKLAALPIIACWIVAPGIAYIICRPLRPKQETLATRDQKTLRRIARRTWSFFEAYAARQRSRVPTRENRLSHLAHKRRAVYRLGASGA
jgi:cyclic beta-1,2-glucan synthetase